MSQIALIAAVVLLVPAIWVARKTTLRRLAWRNVTSRPAEALLITAGTMLGTAIIVASFAVGNTIEDGVGSIVDTSLGPIDVSVTVEDPSQLDGLEQAVQSGDLSNVDGVMSVLSLPTAVTTTGSDPVGEPRVWVAETDFDDARAFGGDTPTSGFADAGATPTGDEAVVISWMAAKLGLEAGDQIEIHAYGSTRSFTVRQIIDRYSAAGFNSIYLPEGTIESFAAGSSQVDQPPRAEVLVSNNGDWIAGAALTADVVSSLETSTGSLTGVEIDPRKTDVLESAAADGAEFTTLFNGIGSFAVIAGIL
ncbi:MAG: ABC transporter permease, partial [Acidimicrobiia bacterium]